jgi:hypothetical protein
MIKRPFFIVGAERSGSTMFRLMLDHHPRVACLYEFELSVDHVGDDGRTPDLAWMRDYLSGPEFGTTFQKVLGADHATYQELMDGILLEKRDGGGKELIGATVHRHYARLLHLWPDAIFLHLLRDGRDVARSRIRMGWDGNVWTAIDEWIACEEAWDRLKAGLEPERYHELRYEDLIADPQGELTPVCELIGVDYSEDMLSYPQHSTYSAPDPKLVYQWRTKATSAETQLMEHKALDVLLDRGYEASGLERIEVSPSKARGLERASRWGRRRFRLRRYGPLLVGLDVLSRTLVRVPSFRRWVEEKLSAVRLKHLK